MNLYSCEPTLLGVCFLGLRLIWFLVIHALCTSAMRETRSCMWPSVEVKRISMNNAFPILVLVIQCEMCWSFYNIDGTAVCLKFPTLWISRLDSMNWRFSPNAEALTFPCVDGLLLLNSLLISSTSLKCSSGTEQMITCLKSSVRISSSLPRVLHKQSEFSRVPILCCRVIRNRDPHFRSSRWGYWMFMYSLDTPSQRRNWETGGFTACSKMCDKTHAHLLFGRHFAASLHIGKRSVGSFAPKNVKLCWFPSKLCIHTCMDWKTSVRFYQIDREVSLGAQHDS